MDYLFLRRHRRTATSNRQKSLLLKAAERQWELQFANKGAEGRKVDCALYKCILYNLEIKQVFLDSELSLKKFSVMIDTNQTYLSNVVNKYFNCNLKELLNTYRVEYAKELLHAGCGCVTFVLSVTGKEETGVTGNKRTKILIMRLICIINFSFLNL